MRKRGEVLEHKPEAPSWEKVDEHTLVRDRECRFCGLPIQRRGLFRRWYHVTETPKEGQA